MKVFSFGWEEMLADFSNASDKVVAFVHDSGSNIDVVG